MLTTCPHIFLLECLFSINTKNRILERQGCASGWSWFGSDLHENIGSESEQRKQPDSGLQPLDGY